MLTEAMRFLHPLLATLAFFIFPTFCQPSIDPTTVKLSSLTYAGTGCVPGSVSASYSGDATVLYLDFDMFIAAAADILPLTKVRANCALNVVSTIPYGWRSRITSVEFNGVVRLDEGLNARMLHALAFESGAPALNSSEYLEIVGPVANRTFSLSEEKKYRDVEVYSRCGNDMKGARSVMNLNLQSRMINSTHPTFLPRPESGISGLFDLYGGKVGSMMIYLQWEECTTFDR